MLPTCAAMLIGIARHPSSRVPAAPAGAVWRVHVRKRAARGGTVSGHGGESRTAPALRAASLFDVDPELAGAARRAPARRGPPPRDRPGRRPAAGAVGAGRAAATRDRAALRRHGRRGARSCASCCSPAARRPSCSGRATSSTSPPADDALLPADGRWSVPRGGARRDPRRPPARSSCAPGPASARVLLDRAARREARLSTHRAIAQLPRVDLRLLAFFAHLAERWGRVAPTGVVIPLHLTHETLGRLIGARRPTVSLALKDLAGDGLLQRREDGAWLLRLRARSSASARTASSARAGSRRRRGGLPRRSPRGPSARRPRRASPVSPAEMAALRARDRGAAGGARRAAVAVHPDARAGARDPREIVRCARSGRVARRYERRARSRPRSRRGRRPSSRRGRRAVAPSRPSRPSRPSSGAVSRIAPLDAVGADAERQQRHGDVHRPPAAVERLELHVDAVVRAGEHPAQRAAHAVERQADVEPEQVLAARLVARARPRARRSRRSRSARAARGRRR